MFTDVAPGLPAADGQVDRAGLRVPASVKTVADQLEAKRLSWKGYMEDMGDDPVRDGGTTCAHPAIGAPDRTQRATPTDQYATRHNPFVYFHSIIDRAALRGARRPAEAPARRPEAPRRRRTSSFITPDLCHDGHDATCADGGPGGLPRPTRSCAPGCRASPRSPAYQRDGLLVDRLRRGGERLDACCGAAARAATRPAPGGAVRPGRGGGRTGAVLLSPFIRPGTTTTQPYNHYSLLRSIEDAFGLAHLGYAAAPGLRPFGDDIFTKR